MKRDRDEENVFDEPSKKMLIPSGGLAMCPATRCNFPDDTINLLWCLKQFGLPKDLQQLILYYAWLDDTMEEMFREEDEWEKWRKDCESSSAFEDDGWREEH